VSPGAPARVLMLTTSSYPHDVRIYHEVSALLAAGHEVTVVCSAVSSTSSEEADPGVRVYRFQNPFLRTHNARVTTTESTPRQGARLKPLGVAGYALGWGGSTVAAFVQSLRALRTPGFDVVHVHNPPDTLAIVAALYRPFGKRLVFDHHDLTAEMYMARARGQGNPLVYRVLLVLEALACRLADHVIATNESYRRVEIERSGVRPDRITIVRNGPDLDWLLAPEPDPEIRSMSGCIVGYVGVMGIQDGVEHLLYALRHLVFDLGKTDVRCVLVGAGDAWESLHALTDELGLSDHVTFVGWLPRAEAMRAAAAIDIGVEPAPSNAYTDRSTMVKVLEYMALRKPVVAFDLRENKFSAGPGALYARSDDDLELARALAALIEDPDRRAALGAAGRQRIEDELAWKFSAQRLVSAYQALLPGSPRPTEQRPQGRRRGRFSERHPEYVARRAVSLVRRYGISDDRAKGRVQRCVGVLAGYGVGATFATPGRVVQRSPRFFRELVAEGTELAVHGYDHVDFRTLSREETRRQFEDAAAVFRRHSIPFSGFRCPYLSFTEEVSEAIPDDLFSYGSNAAIAWEITSSAGRGAVYGQLEGFYKGAPAEEEACVPSRTGGRVEIPVSLPDDLQLLDGLDLSPGEVADAWLEVLGRVHSRGELFAPLFHPESFDLLQPAFESVVRQARELQPAVWIARLMDVADWWNERALFEAHSSRSDGKLQIDFRCSDRGTVLARDWANAGDVSPFEGRWGVLRARTARVASDAMPFVGIAGVEDRTAAFLREQGYLLRDGEDAEGCTAFVDAAVEADAASDRALLEHIESSVGPLLKFSRWPAAARSALCFAGDLDALSLRDYAARFVQRSRRADPSFQGSSKARAGTTW